MSNTTGRICAAIAACLLGAAAVAQDITQQELRSLDDQVQEIKSDVLNIASELNNLEERLLYPSNTQVVVFVALDGGEKFRLDAVEIAIDGELASHHIYSFKELEALQKGGVQKIYTGNIETGGHALNVRMKGKLANGDDFDFADQFSFDKSVEPKVLGVTLARPGSNGIRVGEW
jgi:hypothetical protein